MSLKELYADNGSNGDNVRAQDGTTTYDPHWNPCYCVYGWAHRPVNGKCGACSTPEPS